MMKFLELTRKALSLSERDLAQRAGVARETLRTAEKNPRLIKISHLDSICHALSMKLTLVMSPSEAAVSDVSIVAVSCAICADGFSSWKLHLMNFVDEFRRRPDVRLLVLGPVSTLDRRLVALTASITCTLCGEFGLDVPDWAACEHFLDRPWFVSETESLKAMAILESGIEFRRNNIFVHDNFLKRV